jgi:hypothetical protein
VIVKLRIATNPHLEAKDAQEFADTLMQERATLYDLEDVAPELDIEGIESLKQHLQKSRSSIGVKVVS